ncbi:MAG TPA: response regulator, partial [Phenylobacterium sp.]|nr:response regulator [Phenylobacterium sp.]
MTQGGLVHVIDDDDAVRDSLAVLLSAIGFETCCYPSATDFLEGLDRRDPGCVITDVQMPGMSGLELLDRLSGRS